MSPNDALHAASLAYVKAKLAAEDADKAGRLTPELREAVVLRALALADRFCVALVTTPRKG